MESLDEKRASDRSVRRCAPESTARHSRYIPERQRHCEQKQVSHFGSCCVRSALSRSERPYMVMAPDSAPLSTNSGAVIDG